MSYLDEIGRTIRSNVPESLLPEGDTSLLFRLYAVLLLAKGETVTSEDVHNAWAAWMQAGQGAHPALRPFEDLDARTQASDQPYVAAIRAAWRTMQSS